MSSVTKELQELKEELEKGNIPDSAIQTINWALQVLGNHPNRHCHGCGNVLLTWQERCNYCGSFNAKV